MKTIRLLFVSMLLLSLWGCDSVTSSAPVGDQPANLVAADWNGTWLGTEGAVTMKVVDAEQGLLRAVWIEDSGGELKTETWNIQVRSSGSWSFANVKDDNDGEERFLFARVKKDNRQILFWLPDSDAFLAAVKAGHLPGVIDDSSVRLPALKASDLEYVMATNGPTLFAWDEPLVLLRIRQ